METLNERIKKLRQNKGITQAELANLVSISDKAVSKWEVGDSSPDITLLPILAKIFNVTIDYLLTGEKEETFSLKDLDDNKRLYYLIDKDDAENFEKYGYLNPTKQNNSIFGRSLPTFSDNCHLYSLNENLMQYIFEKKAYKIFSKFCDKLLSLDYGKTNHVITIEKVIDNFVKFVIDIDRSDVLEDLGVRYFSIKYKRKPRYDIIISDWTTLKKNPKDLLINTEDRLGSTINISTPLIKEDTLKYFFSNKKKSPKCYSYITKIDFISKEGNKEGFTKYQILDEILMIGIQHDDFEFVKKTLDFIYTQNNISYDKITNYKSYYDYTLDLLNFVHSKGYNESRIICRLEFISKEIIDNLLYKGKYDLAKLAVDINSELLKTAPRLKVSILSDELYIPNEREMKRIIEISDPKSKSDIRLIKVMKGRILLVDELLKTEDDKFIYECLSKYPISIEELLNNYFKNNDLRSIYEFMCESNYIPSQELLNGELTDKVKEDIYSLFKIKKNSSIKVCCYKPGIYKNGSVQVDKENDPLYYKKELLNKYQSRLELKKFYSNENNVSKYMDKLKNKDFFSLSVELVSLMEKKLIASGYKGKDFCEQLNNYLDKKFPYEYDEDGYVIDNKPEICGLLNRLRKMRNAYLHPNTNETDKPLNEKEFSKCINYIFNEME